MGPRGKIVILDDDRAILKTLGKLLEFLGYSSKCFSNPNDLFNCCNKHQENLHEIFDAFILDMRLPGKMNGIQVLKELKKLDPDIKAIASSGYCDEPVLGQPEKYGFLEALPKPYTIEDLENVITKVVR